jgi:NADPH2:quinone reductase
VKAIRISRTGGPEVLEYVDMPTPVSAPNEGLVKAHAIGVNMPEVLVRGAPMRGCHRCPRFLASR